jgi:putative oxidoreductase
LTRDNLIRVSQVTGRALLAFLFVSAGISKIFTWRAVEGYMASKGVPGVLLPLVVAVEIGGGLGLMFGFFVPWAAGALAGFCALAALLFHFNFQDRNERTSFLKDIALAGALVVIATGVVYKAPATDSGR